MARSRFAAVICDIDGCLTPETADPLDAAALTRLAAYNELAQTRGDRPVITLCSGRPQPFVEAICRLLANRTLPAIAENGVWLWHPATNRYDMDPAITAEHLRAVEAARRWVDIDLGPRGVSIQPGKSASISLYHPHTAILRAIEPEVARRFAAEGWPLRVSMTWLYINCDLAHISKGTAIDRWTTATGIARERLAGIGDTPSDAAIAQRVAFFACPANADARLTPLARYVSNAAEAHGVIDIIERLASGATTQDAATPGGSAG